MVRLVRACGSKRRCRQTRFLLRLGQARKSLWIETSVIESKRKAYEGQARKSLWIETRAHIR